MLKKGFTLAELLISLAVVGVVAALTLPGVINSMPNKEKASYLKAHNTVTNVVAELIDDSSLYFPTFDANGEPNCIGFDCSAAPMQEAIDSLPNFGTNYSGNNKFGLLFAAKVNRIANPSVNGNRVSFTTTDHIPWSIVKNDSDYDISVTINSQNFTFQVDRNGGVRPTDDRGLAYLQDADDLHAR